MLVFINPSLPVLKEATFQDRAMGEIHRLLPRLCRFTKIPYAQCTSLNKSECVLWEDELKDESTYNVCFSGVRSLGMLQPYRGQHYVGVWSSCWSKENCLLCQGTQHHYALGNQPAAFRQSPVGSIAVVYFHFLRSNPFNAFTSSCLAAQLSLQKSKEKVYDGLRTHTYTSSGCSVTCAEKVMCIYLFL